MALILNLGLAFASHAKNPPGVQGTDDRILFDADSYPEFNAVGRLNLEGRGFCSAVLIAPNEILTAAHCIWDPRRRQFLPADMLHFVPGYRRNTYLGHARGIDVRTAATLAFDNDGKPVELADDWAVVTLGINMTDAAGIKPIPLAGRPTVWSLDTHTKLLRVGYGRDRPHLPVRVDNCSIKALLENKRMIVHDCDATTGDSGSPIMISRNGRLLVVGVHSAIASFEDAVFGVAVVLARHLPNRLLSDQLADSDAETSSERLEDQ